MNLKIRKTARKRLTLFVIADIVLVSLSVVAAFMIRFDGKVPAEYLEKGLLQNMIILALLFCIPAFYFFRLYSFSWSFVSTTELVSLFKATTLSFVFLGASIFFLQSFQGFPRSTLIVSYILVFILCGGIRFSKRIYLELFRKGNKPRQRTLIVGAGQAGDQILRNMMGFEESPFSPVGFVDDNPEKKSISIHGVKVLGAIEDIPEVVEKEDIETMIVALPSAGSYAIKKAVDLGRKAGLEKIKVAPPINEVIQKGLSLKDLRSIQVEDLLGREPVSLDSDAVNRFIKGKKVLITGAAGSIGSEMARQTCKFAPSSVLLLDQDESGIFNIGQELKESFPYLKIESLVVDITGEQKIKEIFADYKPDIVFHAAAYKHVPLMEKQPEEAVNNNVFGTKILAEAALQNNTEKFIFISTDKAVNPSSVMGATKRAGEMICQAFNQKNSTKFISVRFGNVLDSRGSVIPTFREQIKRGGPVEVTHPDMKRYFMMIPEAVLLVMQAGEMGKGGEVFVLDMGKPVKILDLAKEMIKLSGLEPDKDIPIVFTKPRAGEKLSEEVLMTEEGTLSTENQRIFKAKLSTIDQSFLEEKLKELGKEENIKEALKELVPTFE